jgi:hypothetical protein
MPSTASAMKIPENTIEDSHSAYGDIQREYSSYKLYSPILKAITNHYQ